MTCSFRLARAFYLGGLLSLLAACEDASAGNGGAAEGGVAGTLLAAGAGGRVNSAGTGNGGAIARGGAASSEAGAIEIGEGGNAGEPHAEGGKGGAHPVAGAGGSGASGGTSNGGSAGGGGEPVREEMIPCDVYAAYSVCRNCHIDPPIDGAPMPLLTLEDLQIYADATVQAVKTGAMPAAGTLSAREAELILGWLDAGAHGVPEAICP